MRDASLADGSHTLEDLKPIDNVSGFTVTGMRVLEERKDVVRACREGQGIVGLYYAAVAL